MMDETEKLVGKKEREIAKYHHQAHLPRLTSYFPPVKT